MTATIILSIVIGVVVILIVRSMIGDVRQGKSIGCKGGCGGCSANGVCKLPQRLETTLPGDRPVIPLRVVK